MAAAVVPPKGEPTTCETACLHRDCAEWRDFFKLTCPYCSEGFEPENLGYATLPRKLQDELEGVLEKVREHVEEHCEYVGEKFTEEARSMHYGEKPERGIYGEASYEDSIELMEEGIEVFPLPGFKKPRTDA